MDLKDFKERVAWGEEFFFLYEREKYWISQNNSEIYLTRVKTSETQMFQSVDKLFECGYVGKKLLVDIWEDIKKYF